VNNNFTRPGLDIWLRCEAADAIASGGGDLSLLSSCASGRITRVLLADVCGTGQLFASISAELRDLIKRNVNSVAQTRVVRQMSRRLDQVAQQGVFASTLVGTYFATTRSLSLCNAGHPPPLLFRAESRKWSILQRRAGEGPASLASPGVVDPTEYQEFRTKLEVGDMLFSCSNALTECRDAAGRTIGLHGTLDRLRHMNPDTPALLAGKLIEQVRAEHDDNLVEDEATILVCQATTRQVPWRDNVLAPLRLFRTPHDATNIK